MTDIYGSPGTADPGARFTGDAPQTDPVSGAQDAVIDSTTATPRGGAPDPQGIWNFREDIGEASAGVVGFDVECVDGHIGKIDAASTEADSSHLVVDTGWWIFGKKRMIPAGAVERISDEEQKVWIKLTKDQVKDAPDWNDTSPATDPGSREVQNTYFGTLRMW